MENITNLYKSYSPAVLLPALSFDEYRGFLPFHIAASCDAEVDTLFFLIRMCPHAISCYNQPEWERQVKRNNRKRKAKMVLNSYD